MHSTFKELIPTVIPLKLFLYSTVILMGECKREFIYFFIQTLKTFLLSTLGVQV